MILAELVKILLGMAVDHELSNPELVRHGEEEVE